jgi:hypothetical protein
MHREMVELQHLHSEAVSDGQAANPHSPHWKTLVPPVIETIISRSRGPRAHRSGSSPIATDRDRIHAHRALKRNFHPASPAGGPRISGPASQLLVLGRGSGSRRPASGPVVPVRAPPPPQQRARTKLTFSSVARTNAPADVRARLDRFGGKRGPHLPESFGTNASKARVSRR